VKPSDKRRKQTSSCL